MAATKSDQWLLQIAAYLDTDDPIGLCRVLQMIVLASSDDTKIALFADSDRRHWGRAELALVANLQQLFIPMLQVQQQQQLPADDILDFLDSVLLSKQQLVDRLNELAGGDR